MYKLNLNEANKMVNFQNINVAPRDHLWLKEAEDLIGSPFTNALPKTGLNANFV